VKSANLSCPICRGEIKQLREAFLNQQRSQPAAVAVPARLSGFVPTPVFGVPVARHAVPAAVRPPPPVVHAAAISVHRPPPPISSSSSSTSTAAGANAALITAQRLVRVPANEKIDAAAAAQGRAMRKARAIEGVPLDVSFALEKENMHFAQSAEVYGIMTIKAPTSIVNNAERPPLDLVCVVDRSASMSGQKIELLQHTLKFIAKQLNPLDRLSILQFDSNCDVLTPLSRMDAKGYQNAARVIDCIKPTGGTNIALGLAIGAVSQQRRLFFFLFIFRHSRFCLLYVYFSCRAGIQVLTKREQDDHNAVASIFLLTDGQDSSSLSQLPFVLKDVPRQTSIHSFGFGADHDARAMTKYRTIRVCNVFFLNCIFLFLSFVDALNRSMAHLRTSRSSTMSVRRSQRRSAVWCGKKTNEQTKKQLFNDIDAKCSSRWSRSICTRDSTFQPAT
jgi:hypothetical protein